MFDIDEIRREFPITRQKFEVLGRKKPKNLIYLDHGASTHPSRRVVDKHRVFLERYYANIHRGNHNLSLIATDLFDRVPEAIADFIGADLENNVVVLSSNTTSAMDMASYFMSCSEGDVLATSMEHHSNDLPYRRRGRVIHSGLNPDGSLDLRDLERKLNGNRVKLVAVTGASNVTGFMPDIHRIARLAHEKGAKILVDAAQLLAHYPIDVKPDGDPGHIDFLAAAGHKAYAPFGSAFLFAPRDILDACDPYIPGGGTVLYVDLKETFWDYSPARHEGETANIAGAIAMAESLKFLKEIGIEGIRKHELELLKIAHRGLEEIEGVTVYGPRDLDRRLGVITFNVEGVTHDLCSAILNYESAIATRNGCFCAHPYLIFLLGITDHHKYLEKIKRGENPERPGAVRATIGIYNTEEEIREFLAAVRTISEGKWLGTYDLSPSSICKPTYFVHRGDGKDKKEAASERCRERVKERR